MVAAIVNEALAPKLTDWFVGWLMMLGWLRAIVGAISAVARIREWGVWAKLKSVARRPFLEIVVYILVAAFFVRDS